MVHKKELERYLQKFGQKKQIPRVLKVTIYLIIPSRLKSVKIQLARRIVGIQTCLVFVMKILLIFSQKL